MLRFTEAQLAEYEKRTKVAPVPAPVAAPAKKAKRQPTEAQQLLALQLAPLGFVAEHRFAAPRRWRFDFALLGEDMKIAVELDGGVWTNGRHTRGSGFIKDAEKTNEAAIRGWLLLRVVPEQVKSGEALATVYRAIEARCQKAAMFHGSNEPQPIVAKQIGETMHFPVKHG